MKEEKERKQREKEEKMKINPKDMFRSMTDLYSAWNEQVCEGSCLCNHQGIPTHDKDGNPINKSASKKIMKQYQQQEKLYNEYLKSLQTQQ